MFPPLHCQSLRKSDDFRFAEFEKCGSCVQKSCKEVIGDSLEVNTIQWEIPV